MKTRLFKPNYHDCWYTNNMSIDKLVNALPVQIRRIIRSPDYFEERISWYNRQLRNLARGGQVAAETIENLVTLGLPVTSTVRFYEIILAVDRVCAQTQYIQTYLREGLEFFHRATITRCWPDIKRE